MSISLAGGWRRQRAVPLRVCRGLAVICPAASATALPSRQRRHCNAAPHRSPPQAPPARARAPIIPRQRLHRDIIGHQQPVKADVLARIIAIIAGRLRGGACASMASKTICAVIAIGRSASAVNGAKSCASSSARSTVDRGRSLWLSTVARPWPGICLSTGNTPPASSPSATAAPSRRSPSRGSRNSGCAGKRMGLGPATSASGAQLASIPSAPIPPRSAGSAATSRARPGGLRLDPGPAAAAIRANGARASAAPARLPDRW